MKITEKLFVSLGILGTIFLGLVFVALLIWSFYPYKTVTYNKQPFKVITKEVKAGDKIVYEVDACKHTTIKPNVDVIFVDSIRYLSDENFAALSTGCQVIRVARNVPVTLPTGKYHLELQIRYHMNPIRTIIHTVETEEFEVMKGDD